MNSNDFIIESASVSDAAGNKSSAGYKLSDTIGQLAAGEFSSTGYIIKAGFQYLRPILPFKFSISNVNVNLETLLPNMPKIATTMLTVSPGSARSYQVTVSEIGKLRMLSGNFIPDTSCDSGNCTTTSAAVWSSNSAYGFGYNMKGQDISLDFINDSYFRPFSDDTVGGNPAIIMNSANASKTRQSTMTIKANISNLQPTGNYNTVLNFIAIPSY